MPKKNRKSNYRNTFRKKRSTSHTRKLQKGGNVKINTALALKKMGGKLATTKSNLYGSVAPPLRNVTESIIKDRIQKEMNPNKSILQQAVNKKNNMGKVYIPPAQKFI